MRKAVLLLLLALATGVAWAFEFSREGHLLSPWVALAPGLLLLGTRRPVLSSFLWGIGFWTAGVYWILDTLVTYGQLEGWLGGLALLILAAILGGYQALFAWPGARLWRRAAEGDLLSGLVGLPALWLICEWLRGHLFSGFPWNLAGYAWVEVPGALELSAWIGAYGLSALVVAANAGVALAARRRSLLPLALGWMVPLLLLALGGRFAHPPELPDSLPAPVRIVQPNIPNLVTWDTAVAARNYSRLLDLSREAC
nr:hypothetical protein [Thermoanaerobaculia bacterium]